MSMSAAYSYDAGYAYVRHTSPSLARCTACAQAAAQAPLRFRTAVSPRRKHRSKPLRSTARCHGLALSGASRRADRDLFTTSSGGDRSRRSSSNSLRQAAQAEANRTDSEQAADLVRMFSRAWLLPARPTFRRLLRRTARSAGRLVARDNTALRAGMRHRNLAQLIAACSSHSKLISRSRVEPRICAAASNQPAGRRRSIWGYGVTDGRG